MQPTRRRPTQRARCLRASRSDTRPFESSLVASARSVTTPRRSAPIHAHPRLTRDCASTKKGAKHGRLFFGEPILAREVKQCSRVRTLPLNAPCLRTGSLDKQVQEKRDARGSKGPSIALAVSWHSRERIEHAAGRHRTHIERRLPVLKRAIVWAAAFAERIARGFSRFPCTSFGWLSEIIAFHAFRPVPHDAPAYAAAPLRCPRGAVRRLATVSARNSHFGLSKPPCRSRSPSQPKPIAPMSQGSKSR